MRQQRLAGGVVADHGDQGDRRRQARQVFRDVAGHAAERLVLAGRIGGAHLESGVRAQFAVQIGAAQADDRAIVGQDIGAAKQPAVTDQSGDIAGHGRAGQAQLDGQVLLRNEGICPDELVQLVFF
jgi:hypothetical protein